MIEGARKRMSGAHVRHNSGNNEWYTPPHIIAAVRDYFGGTIDLDPASCPVANRVVGATHIFTKDDDGLGQMWAPYGNIWVNPPYGRGVFSAFVDKIEIEARNGAHMLVLVNNGTETNAGQRLLRAADDVCFISGRVKFLDETGVPKYTPLQGQMLLGMNLDRLRFYATFSPFGVVR